VSSNLTSSALRQAQCKHVKYTELKKYVVCIYMLLCDQKTFYVGITDNPEKRLVDHKNKKSFFTKKFSDIKFVYCEGYSGKHEAVLREKQIKGWSHAKKQMLIDGKLGYNVCTEFVEVLGKVR
jgi:putative endonuclease